MLIPPKYELTPKISKLLASIEGSKQIIDSVNIPLEVEMNIRRKSTLRSSLFSARIEGNDLTPEELDNTPSKNQKKIEVFNILRAINFLKLKEKKDISLNDILSLHRIVMNELSPASGKFRNEVEAIFNSDNIAIYMPPSPRLVIPLLTKLLKFINTTQKEQFVPVKACLAHYVFEKIHPFVDGNGRVGRILIQKILGREDYSMKGLLSIEEYLDNHRQEYYHSLDDPERDVTGYLEFMLESIDTTAQLSKELVQQKKDNNFLDSMLPRRAEIYSIIKDQRIINFDSLHRRFLSVNKRTLRYDLLKLQQANLIRKRGTTKGVYYEII